MKKLSHVLSAISLLLAFSPEAYAVNCPEPDALNHYVTSALHPGIEKSEAAIQIFYRLLAPFDSSKPTLFVINGGPGGDHRFLFAFEKTQLAQSANIVSFDHRGLGCTKIQSSEHSEYEPLLFSMEKTSEDIEAIRKDLLGDEGKWFVYGVSYGTMLGQQYAILYPGSIQGLILDSAMHESSALEYGRKNFIPLFIDSNPQTQSLFTEFVRKNPALRTEVLRKIRPMTYTFFGRTQIIPQYLKQLNDARNEEELDATLKTAGDIEPPLVGMTRQIICEEIWDYPETPAEDQYYFWQFAEECRGFLERRFPMSFSEKLKQLRVKTMIWGGAFDPATPIEAMREMHQLIPNSIFWENAQAGHALIGEKSECALHLARHFIQGAGDPELSQMIQSEECQSGPSEFHTPEERFRLNILEKALNPVGIKYPLF